MIYVTPSDGLVIRAGQHVDPQGRVYHPYLARWADHSDVSVVRHPYSEPEKHADVRYRSPTYSTFLLY